MCKIKRKEIVVSSSYYNFEERYEKEMSYFDDKDVISVNVIKSEEDSSGKREEYIVFYR